jgi:hypothetical protein
MDNPVDDLEIAEPEEERQYSFREKALRDYFIKQYLEDYDSIAAAIRVGYPRSVAKEFATRFMNEPYVLREIYRLEGGGSVKDNDPEAEQKRIIAGLKREANYRGPGSSQAARVAALSRLATLYEMDPAHKKPKDEENELEGNFVTPGIMTPEQWAEAARKQQEELVAGGAVIQPTTPSIH